MQMYFHIDSIYANVVKCIYTDLIHFKIELCLNFILEHRRHQFYSACVTLLVIDCHWSPPSYLVNRWQATS